MTGRAARAITGVTAVAVVLLAAACGSADRAGPPTSGSSSSASTSDSPYVMAKPGSLTKAILSPDVLIYSRKTLTPSVVDAIKGVRGVSATERFAMAQFYFEENGVTYAAVNPATFRRWTVDGTAQSNAVWDRVADGEIGLVPRIDRKIAVDDYVRVGTGASAPKLHVGALAQLLSPINSLNLDAVVNERYVKRLSMVPDNAMLVSTGITSPQSILAKIRKAAGSAASVQILGPDFDLHATQTAILTGESAVAAAGRFNYTLAAGGHVVPQASWVRRYIRTEEVPIIGKVTCNKVMIPQLRAALNDVVAQGLAKYIHPSQYGGCYVPRYIAGTHTLSYHAFGMAVDLNVPGNERGTVGQMNRSVVKVFEKWGFVWGGTWHYTDPMHFELHRIVRVG